MVNGDLVNGHLREIFPIFPADFRRYSRWLPLIRQIISKLNFPSAAICAAFICGHLREIFPVFPVNGEWRFCEWILGEWWKFGHLAVSVAQCKPNQHTISFQLTSFQFSVKNTASPSSVPSIWMVDCFFSWPALNYFVVITIADSLSSTISVIRYQLSIIRYPLSIFS